MKLQQETIQELGVILKEEFNIRLSKKELKEFAYFLVSFFSIMLKFESRPTPRIDNEKTTVHDEKGDKI